MGKKNITSFIGITLIGAIFIGAYVFMNKGNIKIGYVKAYQKITKKNYPSNYDKNYVEQTDSDIYNSVLTFTNNLVINTQSNCKFTDMVSRETLENYINKLSNSKMDTIIKENLQAYLNDDFSNIIAFHNYIDKKLNWSMNQVKDVDQLGIEEHRRLWGLATEEIEGFGSIHYNNIINI